MNVFETIEFYYPSLTSSEKRVADYYLVTRQSVAEKRLAEIAEDLQIGEATIVRFCKKIGYSSFKELRMKIFYETNSYFKYKPDNFVASIQENIYTAIGKTVEILQMENLNLAIRMIDEAQEVMCMGVGVSGSAAEITAMRFIRSGKHCSCITDPHFAAMYCSTSTDQTVIIAFSVSGRISDTIHCVQCAKANKAKIIAITNFNNSPLAKLADIVILTAQKENPIDGGNLIAQMNQVFIADLITTGYALLDMEKTMEMRRKTSASIQSKSVD